MQPDPKAARALVTGAYLATIIAAALLETGLLLSFSADPPELLWVYFVGGGLNAIVAMLLGFYAILKRTGGAGEHVLFSTWFPMFMAAVPIAGPVIALISAIKLLRGRIGPATITSTSGSSRSTSSYDALYLHGSGVPAGLLLLFLVSLQPQIAWFVYQQETAPDQVEEPAPVAARPAAEQPAPGEPTAEKRRRKIWVMEDIVCQGVFECYTAADHVGPATGKLIVELGADGRAKDVRLRLASTPQKVAECLIDLGEDIAFEDYRGPGGVLTCEFAGQVSGRVVSGKKAGHFVPRVER